MSNFRITEKLAIAVLASTMFLGCISRPPPHEVLVRNDQGWFYTRHYLPFGAETREIPFGATRFFLGGVEYFYVEGMFYRPVGIHRFVVVAAPLGAVVGTLPEGCCPVVIDGLSCYLINGNTYVVTSIGFQAAPPPKTVTVQPPSVVPQMSAVSASTTFVHPAPAPTVTTNAITINVPNANGTCTPVILTPSDKGFVGPQGEFYNEMPPMDQLKVMYGK